MELELITVDVHNATHVRVAGAVERIASTWGIEDGKVAPPSKGGFGVITESGRKVSMWEAEGYFMESAKQKADRTIAGELLAVIQHTQNLQEAIADEQARVVAFKDKTRWNELEQLRLTVDRLFANAERVEWSPKGGK